MPKGNGVMDNLGEILFATARGTEKVYVIDKESAQKISTSLGNEIHKAVMKIREKEKADLSKIDNIRVY